MHYETRPRSVRVLLAAALAMATLLLFPTAAGAQYGEPPPGSTTTVLSTNFPKPSTEGLPNTNTDPTVLGTQVNRSSFAFTGGDAIAMAAIGGGLVAAGSALVVAARRRRALGIA